jgi:hypothetical protein
MLHAWFRERFRIQRGCVPFRAIEFKPIRPLILEKPKQPIRLFELHHGIVIITPLDKLLWNIVEWYNINLN